MDLLQIIELGQRLFLRINDQSVRAHARPMSTGCSPAPSIPSAKAFGITKTSPPRGLYRGGWGVPRYLAGSPPVAPSAGEEHASIPRDLPQHLLGCLGRQYIVGGGIVQHEIQVVIRQNAPEVEKFLPDVEVCEVVQVLRLVANTRECGGLLDLHAFN